jgi:SEC-C motif
VTTDLTPEVLRRHFDEQLDFLRASGARFDAGEEHEAKRLGTTIRTVVCDMPTSLLSHLGVKNELGFVDHALPDPPPPPVVVLGFGLCRVHMSADGVRYVPAMTPYDPQRQHPPVSFDDWWQHPILFDLEGRSYSRRELIRSLVDQDGGAHIDKTLNDKYRALIASNAMRMQDESSQPIQNGIVAPSVRHAAAELMETLETRIRWDGYKPIVDQPICPLPLDFDAQIERNDPCPCGSGRKLKKCFLLRQGRLQSRISSNGEDRIVPGRLGPGARPAPLDPSNPAIPKSLGFKFGDFD